MNNEAGKGDTYRPVDYQKYRDNWDNIFGDKEKNKFIKYKFEKIGMTLEELNELKKHGI